MSTVNKLFNWIGSNVVRPLADSITALQITKTDGTSVILNVDSTNSRIGILSTVPKAALDVGGGVKVGADVDAASSDKIGTVRTRIVGNVSSLDLCRQRSVGVYEWVELMDVKQTNALTNGSLWIGNASNAPIEIPSVMTYLSIGDFQNAYAGLAVEANWTNNFCSGATVAGASGDLHFGVGANGTSYYAHYGQSGWNRSYTDHRVTDAALIAILQTTANWTADTYNVVAGTNRGDLMQVYEDSTYEYACIDGASKTWYRRLKVSNTVTTTDVAYLPFPQIAVGKTNVALNDTIIIPAKCDVVKMRVVAEGTTAGNISIGSVKGLSDVVASTELPTTAGQGIQLDYIENPAYPNGSDRTLYINIDSAASVTLQIVNQKIY